MKKIFFVFVAITLLAAVALLIRSSFGGPEDSWICQNGAWVKQGNPSVDMPSVGCESEPLPPDAN